MSIPVKQNSHFTAVEHKTDAKYLKKEGAVKVTFFSSPISFQVKCFKFSKTSQELDFILDFNSRSNTSPEVLYPRKITELLRAFNFNLVNYSQAVTNLKSQGCHTARAESPALFLTLFENLMVFNKQTEDIPEQTQQPI